MILDHLYLIEEFQYTGEQIVGLTLKHFKHINIYEQQNKEVYNGRTAKSLYGLCRSTVELITELVREQKKLMV
jgi:hypothetical protein